MTIEAVISSGTFRYFLFPLLSAGAGILLKCVTRNDKYAFFKKEDMAVGPELMLTAALTYVVVTTDRAHALMQTNSKIADILGTKPENQQALSDLHQAAFELSQRMMGAAWFLLMLFISLWAVTTLVKRWGWETEQELRPVRGIALPLGVGVLSLIMVMLAVQP